MTGSILHLEYATSLENSGVYASHSTVVAIGWMPVTWEYIDGSKAIVYSSKSGHAGFSHAGTYIQRSSKLGVDSSINYELVAAEYLGDVVASEPRWLQFMGEWGPTIVYDSKTELDKIISVLPLILRTSVENLLNKLPVEQYGEEGPTGPNWVEMKDGKFILCSYHMD